MLFCVMPHVPPVPPLCAGRVYRPNVLRVGNDREGSVAVAVRDRLVGAMVERYRTMTQGEWQLK